MTDIRPAPDRHRAGAAPTDLQVGTHALSVDITARTPIHATAEAVWRVLLDTAAYPEWNPFVRRLEGRILVGERLTVALAPAGKEQVLKPRVVDVQPGRSFTWLGRVGVPGVLDGRHHLEVLPDRDGSRSILVQHERLSGLLVPAFRGMLTRDAPRAFVASNEALAARVERRP